MPDTTRATLAAGYGSGRRRSRTESKASAYRPDPEAERLLALQKNEPQKFDALPTSVKLQLAYYQSAKTAAAEVATDPEGADHR